MKLKSLLTEALNPLDKKAVEAFFDGKPFEGKNLNSDGKTLKTVGIGSQPMYTHTPNGVKMVGKVTGGYSQSLVQYVNKVHKGDLGEARIPNNSTSARMAGLVSTSNINNLFKVVEPLIEELSADGFDLEDIVGFIAKRIEAKFSGLYEGKTLNENINKNVKSFLDKSLKGLKAGSPPHLFAVKHTLIGALTDANFHSEAKKVPALFPKAEFEPTSYGENEKEAIKMYEYEVGPQIARIAGYDGGAIVDAIGFYVSMTIGRPVGEKITKLVESSIKEVKYPTNLYVGSVVLGQGFTALKGIEGGKYYKVVEMDDISATLVPSDIKGNVKGTKKVRHKLSSIEGGIKTAKRGDENGIVVI